MPRRRFAAFAGVIAFAFAAGVLLWNNRAERVYSRTTFAMDTVMVFSAYGPNAPDALDEALGEVQRLDKLLSAQDPDSEVSRLNRGGVVPVSEDTESLLRAAKEAFALTGGLFDCSVYPLMKLWGFPEKDYHVPSQERIAALLPLVDSERIDVSDGSAQLGEGQEIDFGGIAKGYAAMCVMEIFRRHGVKNAMISLGGNVQVMGAYQGRHPWTIAVQDPFGGEDYPAVVQVRDSAVVTSGGYQRFFVEDGKRYCHILDPRSGMPAESDLSSVTVVTPDGVLADALSTALFVMGAEDAARFWREHDGFEIVLIDAGGKVFVSEGLSQNVDAPGGFTLIRR